MTRHLAPILVGVLALPACSNQEPPQTTPAPASKKAGAEAAAPPQAARAAPPVDRTPRNQTDYPTTDGQIALSNLTSQIDGQDQVLARTHNVEINGALANLLLVRGQVTGKIADYERAETLTNELIKARPKSAIAWVTHAAVMSTFHRFDDALADYKRAEKLGYHTVELVAPREGIAAARGKDEEALAYREKMAKEIPGIDTIGALAVTKGDLGMTKEAEQLFGDAQDKYGNVSPFPVSLLYFQNGLLEQRAGSPARARALFKAAHDRLPCYPQATAHLASVLEATGDRDKAIELLRTVAEGDDPEFAGQLAGALKAAGKPEDVDKLTKQAAARFDELIRKYPLAFADHAARFWMGPGGDAKRALTLAQLNLKNRASADALRLVIEAAVAANDDKLACKTADALLARRWVTAYSRVAAAKAYVACGQKERGERELATAMKDGDKP